MNDADEFMNMFKGMAGMTDPKIGYHCTKCKYELMKVKSGQAYDFQKMFYCTNKNCVKFGMVTVVAVKKSK